ncbi:MAG: homoserine kinase [Dehalococcoidia bacterium]|nr:homoserine kinase [Dehalococcoidia bacterium]
MSSSASVNGVGNEQAVTLEVPATTSNLGPGFDTLGLALDLCNEVTLRIGRIGDASGIDRISGEGQDALATDESNLVLRAATTLYQKLGQSPPPLRASLRNRIPLARGLGSSGTAVIGGLLAANTLAGEPYDSADLLAIATDLEGHPDNVAPALLGGLVISALAESRDGPRILTHRLDPPPAAIALCIPDQPLATEAARQVIPRRVSLNTAVHNLGRVALLVAALATGDYTHLREAMDDRLHQPPRASVFPPLEPVIAAALAAGAAGSCLSGAGSTLLALVPESTHAAHTVAAAMVQASAAAGYPAQPAVVHPREQGAVVIEKSSV